MTDVRIERMRPGHWPAVRAIYEAGIASGNATLEREAPEWEVWKRAIGPTAGSSPSTATGSWAGSPLAPYSGRASIAGVAWLSVYVAPDAQGRGRRRRPDRGRSSRPPTRPGSGR